MYCNSGRTGQGAIEMQPTLRDFVTTFTPKINLKIHPEESTYQESYSRIFFLRFEPKSWLSRIHLCVAGCISIASISSTPTAILLLDFFEKKNCSWLVLQANFLALNRNYCKIVRNSVRSRKESVLPANPYKWSRFQPEIYQCRDQ